MHYFFYILVLIQLVTLILRLAFKALRTIPAFNHWVEATAKSALKKLKKVILAIVFVVLVVILFFPRLLLIFIYRYFAYYRKRQVAQNPETEPEQLRKLAEVRDPGTKRRIAGNPNTPPDVLLTLGKEFPKELLANPVFDLMLLENANLFETMPSATLKSLMCVKDIPVRFLERAATIPNLRVDIARVIAQHPKATEYVFEQVARYSSDVTVARLLVERSSGRKFISANRPGSKL